MASTNHPTTAAEPTGSVLVVLGDVGQKNTERSAELAARIEDIAAKLLGEVKPMDPTLPSPYGGRLGDVLARQWEIAHNLDRIEGAIGRLAQAMG